MLETESDNGIEVSVRIYFNALELFLSKKIFIKSLKG